MSAERGSSLSGKQKRRTQNGEYTEDVKQALKDAGIDANKKGEHRMENTKSHTPVALRKQIGGTMYVVRVHFNEDAKETMKDKIKRLIENDVRGTQHTA